MLNKTAQAQIEFHYKEMDGSAVAIWEKVIRPSLEKKGFWSGTTKNKEEYHQLPGWNSSRNGAFMRNPYEIKLLRVHPELAPKSKDMDDGTKFHEIILEGGVWVSDTDEVRKLSEKFKNPRNTKDYKKWVDEQKEAGFHVITEEQLIAICEWKDAIDGCELFEIFNHKESVVERAIFMVDERTGLILKCCPDIYNEDLGIIGDAKFATTANGNTWNKQVRTYEYNIQLVHYLHILKKVYPKVDWTFAFFEFQKKVPFNCGAKAIPPGLMAATEKMFESLLERVAKCYRTGDWGNNWSDEVEFCDENEYIVERYENYINEGGTNDSKE